ncbi:MAG: Gfo/Idh/MocA family oxidoreductase [Candidatus Nanohaloarchaea archaeon]
METVKVFHIGLGSFGRYGFEKFVEMDNHLEEVNVELIGVCDKDFEKLEDAEKFASAQGLDIDSWRSIEDAYQRAIDEDSEDCKILIYDAGPAQTHADHIYRSLRNNFFHLAEKPPSMTREEHIKEKKLMLDNDVRFTVDFIERESPVVKKALQILEGKNIDSIEVFRESTIGIEKLLNPIDRAGVKGGSVLDKMSHEGFVMDFVEPEEIENVEKGLYMPNKKDGGSLMTIRGGKTSKIDELTATGTCRAEISGDADIALNSSWLGVSPRARAVAEEMKEITDHNPIGSDFKISNESGLLDEECRFFVIKGERDLFGDMLSKNLYDLETGEEIETPNLIHDQLYRVLESSVRCAAGLENNSMSEENIDQYMNLIFDIMATNENRDVFEEVEKANSRVDELVLDNVFESEASKSNV